MVCSNVLHQKSLLMTSSRSIQVRPLSKYTRTESQAVLINAKYQETTSARMFQWEPKLSCKLYQFNTKYQGTIFTRRIQRGHRLSFKLYRFNANTQCTISWAIDVSQTLARINAKTISNISARMFQREPKYFALL